MLKGARVAVVVPAFNEARWIHDTIASIPELVDHILVVDDASVDDTVSIAQNVNDGRVTVIQHPRNRGVGAAIVTGYRSALNLGADVTAVLAGDGQMDPEDLAAVLDPAIRRDADYVKGNRLAHPDVLRRMPRLRRLATMFLAWLTRHAAGLEALSDSQCGYTAISADALRAIDINDVWPRYGYPNDLLGAIALAGLRIHEVPVRPIYRDEASGIRPWHLTGILFIIARIACRRAARRRAPAGIIDCRTR